MKKWEYLEVFRDLDDRDAQFTREGKAYNFIEYINHLGEQGWELVSSYTINDQKARYIFKRPKA